MNQVYLSALDYHVILERLAEHTSFSASRELALGLYPSSDYDEVAQRLAETDEAKHLLSLRPEVTVGGVRDVHPLLERARVYAPLQPTELLDVRATLVSGAMLRRLLTRLEHQFPLLADRAYAIAPLAHIVEEMDRCLDGDGNVLDSASPELARIRKETYAARERVITRLHAIISSERNSPYLQEPLITERNGRYVIPLKAQFRGRIPGVVHDQSASGATLFIEPLETVELNNRYHELQIEERHEIERILAALSHLVGDEAEAIDGNVRMIAEIDLALAKARYSYATKGVPAELTRDQWPTAEPRAKVPPSAQPLYLARARHPLLPPETVVPIDVYAGAGFTALVITGPNTGGKTVSLRTIGLLAAMNQAGLHIPAGEGSRLPVFSGIYADIGDEQSVEQNLSTFSSHMTHIVDIFGHADEHSLVLLDELGAGTDPVEGAALAQALLDTFVERRSLLFCSSHYSQLKVYAFSADWVENASVEFDVETLAPTYRLTIGLPGRSNAFAIARRLGLDEEIIRKAEALLAPEQTRAEELLARAAEASEEAERLQTEATRRLEDARKLQERLDQQLQTIEQERQRVLEEAHQTGRRELEELRAELRRIRGSLAANPALSEATEAVERLVREFAPPRPRERATAEQDKGLQVGDTVYVTSLGQRGELLRVSDDEAEVRVGGLRLRTAPSRLRFESRPMQEQDAASPASVTATQRESPGTELDIRGWRAEEVEPALERYLEHAYLAGLPWVTIIHGKGMGVLKQVVRDHLSGHPLVASWRPGAEGEGGDGVTVVTLHEHR